MTISTPITLAGGTLYTDDGSYILDALNVTAASTLTMKWRKGLVMRRFWSSGDLAVVNNPGTDSDADPANGARFTFLYPNEAGSADAASEYTGTLTASFANTPGTNQYMILKAGATNTFSAATVKVASKHIDLLLGNDGKTLTSGTVIFTNVAVQGASFGEEATWTLNGGTLQWGDGGTNALSAGASTFLGGSVEVKGGATLALHPWESKPSNGQMVTVSTPITLEGGTLQTKDGSYVFSKVDIQAASTADFMFDKTITVSTLLGSGDLAVKNSSTIWGRATLSVVNTHDETGDYTGKMTITSARSGWYNSQYAWQAEALRSAINELTLGSAAAFSQGSLAFEKDECDSEQERFEVDKGSPKHILAQDKTVTNLIGYATVASADDTTASLTLTGTLAGAMTFTVPVTLANEATVQVTSANEYPTFSSLTNAGTTKVSFADDLNQAGTVVLASTDKQDGLTFSGAGTGLTFVSAEADGLNQLQVATKPMLPEGGNDALAQKIAQAGQDAGKTVTEVKVEEGCSLNGLELFEQVLDIADSGVATVTYDFGIDWMDIVNNKLILCAKVQQSNEAGAILPDSTTITLQSSTDNGVTWQTVTAETVTAESLGRTANAGTRYLRVEKPTQSTRYRITASNTTNN